MIERFEQLLRDSVFLAVRGAGLMPLSRALFAGRGVILAFHEIQEEPASELITGTRPEFLHFAIGWLKEHDWDIVSLDEATRRLAGGASERRYAVLTFDDGYKDIAIAALPVLERSNVPFTAFVPTGAPTGTLYSWWLGLRELFRSRSTVRIDAMGRRFNCPDLRTKVAAMREVIRWVHQDFRRKTALSPAFESADISFADINARYFLGEAELKAFSRHRLATIGAHTRSHAALATLDENGAREEVIENRAYLEALLDRPVRHLAYPYGEPAAFGSREIALAASLGFASAVTTRHGHLTTREAVCLHALPRVAISPFETATSFIAKMSGLQRAMLAMLGREYDHAQSKTTGFGAITSALPQQKT